MSVHDVVVVMGVSGSGKTTIGTALAAELGVPFCEGDALHPAANIRKMAAGHPLDDADRAPWLAAVAAWIDETIAAGHGGVVSCSALRRAYRDVLRRPPVLFAHLTGPRDVLLARMIHRHEHFMPAGLLDSQLATLEPPGPDERAIDIDIRLEPGAQVQAVRDALDAPGD